MHNFVVTDENDQVIVLASDGEYVIKNGYKVIDEEDDKQFMFEDNDGNIFFKGQSLREG